MKKLENTSGSGESESKESGDKSEVAQSTAEKKDVDTPKPTPDVVDIIQTQEGSTDPESKESGDESEAESKESADESEAESKESSLHSSQKESGRKSEAESKESADKSEVAQLTSGKKDVDPPKPNPDVVDSLQSQEGSTYPESKESGDESEAESKKSGDKSEAESKESTLHSS